LDLTDPFIINSARIAFLVGTLISWLILAVIYLRIQYKQDKTPIIVKESDIDPQKAAQANPMGQLFGSSEGYGRNVESTVYEYDRIQLRALIKSALMGPIITLFIHYKWVNYYYIPSQ
jgi:hypothetical protein